MLLSGSAIIGGCILLCMSVFAFLNFNAPTNGDSELIDDVNDDQFRMMIVLLATVAVSIGFIWYGIMSL